MLKPDRHIWEEGSTHRAIAGKEYDEVWNYAEHLEARLDHEKMCMVGCLNDNKKWHGKWEALKAANAALQLDYNNLRKAVGQGMADTLKDCQKQVEGLREALLEAKVTLESIDDNHPQTEYALKKVEKALQGAE